jgi:hypothetical protein
LDHNDGTLSVNSVRKSPCLADRLFLWNLSPGRGAPSMRGAINKKSAMTRRCWALLARGWFMRPPRRASLAGVFRLFSEHPPARLWTLIFINNKAKDKQSQVWRPRPKYPGSRTVRAFVQGIFTAGPVPGARKNVIYRWRRRYVSSNNVALDDANLIFLQWRPSRLKLGATRRPDSGHSGIRILYTDNRRSAESKTSTARMPLAPDPLYFYQTRNFSTTNERRVADWSTRTTW